MSEKTIQKEFRRFARTNLISPGKCKKLEQTRHSISTLHKKIVELNSRFNYVPDDARLLFNEYQTIQDRKIFENFRRDYLSKLC
jgi:hypothetical protein